MTIFGAIVSKFFCILPTTENEAIKSILKYFNYVLN